MYEAKGLHPNLDYPAGPAYHLIGFDTPTFTPIFVAARLPGWTAHIAEQFAGNSLIRPLWPPTTAPPNAAWRSEGAAMLRTFMRSKIHRATVTGSDLNYVGSLTLSPELLKAADIGIHELVQVVDINNGARFGPTRSQSLLAQAM